MTNPERTVLVDMDGTVANLDATIGQALRQEFPEIPLPERSNFYYEEDLAPEHRYAIQEIISRQGFFAEHPVIDGALEGWQAMQEQGYEPRICSAPLRKNRWSIAEKIAWLEQHFVPTLGPEVIDRAIIDKRKYRHAGLALIDDRPAIDGTDKAPWEHIVFDQTYNHDSRAQYRILSWQDKGLFVALGSLANRQV